jgi:hypothetical protein
LRLRVPFDDVRLHPVHIDLMFHSHTACLGKPDWREVDPGVGERRDQTAEYQAVDGVVSYHDDRDGSTPLGGRCHGADDSDSEDPRRGPNRSTRAVE